MNVTLPANTIVDLYAATGLTVGTVITVTNLTPDSVRLYSVADATFADDHYPCEFNACPVTNKATDTGAFATSVVGGAVDVQEAV